MAKIKTVHGTEERKVVSQKEWLAARLELLKAEKELTRRNDELAERRQQLPWVRIDKEYRFETDEGKASLADLFRGRSQLLIYHFMFGTDVNTYIRERPGMSAFALEDGVVYHTYSTYARGLDGLWGMYQWLDRAPRDATRSASGGTATTSTKASRFGVKASQKTAAL